MSAHTAAQETGAANISLDPTSPGPLHHLATCRRALKSDRTVAEILGVSPSQVSRWRSGQIPDPDNADRLGGLALVVELLSRWLAPESVEGWLCGPNAHLSDRAPAYLIHQGQVADVIGAIEAEKVRVAPSSMGRLADLCDPSYLVASGTAPDMTASGFRMPSQPVARAAWDAGFDGIRWWSSFWGDLHTVVLFTARVEGKLAFGNPEVLTVEHAVVRKAAELLGMLA